MAQWLERHDFCILIGDFFGCCYNIGATKEMACVLSFVIRIVVQVCLR